MSTNGLNKLKEMYENAQVPGYSMSGSSPSYFDIPKSPMIKADYSSIKTAQKRAILQIRRDSSIEDHDQKALKELLKKRSIKFILEDITELEDDFRKQILWHLQDCKFRKANSSTTWEIFFCFNFKLPESVKVPWPISPCLLVIIRLESRSSITSKYDQELKFILLNNEVSVHHTSTGPAIEILTAGHSLTVPPNKRFYMFNGDVSTSHILMLLPPSMDTSKLPKFLS